MDLTRGRAPDAVDRIAHAAATRTKSRSMPANAGRRAEREVLARLAHEQIVELFPQRAA
jgi:hypothetical protein